MQNGNEGFSLQAHDNFDHPKVSLVIGMEIVHKTGRMVVKSHV